MPDAASRPSLRPRLCAVSFLHRFGSAFNRHIHLHARVTDGLFMPAGRGVAFLPASPVTTADLATLTERVRYRLVRCFLRKRLLDADADADMLAWQNSGFSIDASVRVALVDRVVPSYFRSLEHLLRHCARPAVTARAIGNLGQRPDAAASLPLGECQGEAAQNHEQPRSHDTSNELVQFHDDREANQASPDYLPAIDINSL